MVIKIPQWNGVHQSLMYGDALNEATLKKFIILVDVDFLSTNLWAMAVMHRNINANASTQMLRFKRMLNPIWRQ